MGKLSIFLLLTILINITWAELPGDSLTTTSDAKEWNEEAVLVSATADDGESIPTQTEIEQDTTTEKELANSIKAEEPATTEPAVEEVTNKQNEATNTNLEDQVPKEEINNQNESTNTNLEEQAPTEVAKDTEPTTEIKTPNVVNTEENTSELNKDVEDTATNPAAESQTTTVAPATVCTTPGVQAHDTDCRQYYECSATVGAQDSTLYLTKKSCPEKQAFSVPLNRCSRDISSCPSDIKCTIEGSLADPASNTSFYYCKKRYNETTGFYLFHIDCESYQKYYSEFGKCFYNPALAVVPPQISNRPTDADVVLGEMKVIKSAWKLKGKEEKEQRKAAKKLQKEKEKEAKNQAKKEEKLKKEKAKLEAASYVCVKEGNFASQFADNKYIACITKKDKFKAVSMQCPAGIKFNAETGICGNTANTEDNSLPSDEKDED